MKRGASQIRETKETRRGLKRETNLLMAFLANADMAVSVRAPVCSYFWPLEKLRGGEGQSEMRSLRR